MIPSPLTLSSLQAAYREGRTTPREVLAQLRAKLHPDDPAWIHRCNDGFVNAQLATLEGHGPETLPLYGIPFAVKDNIDVAGLPTTAACPAFSYTATTTARAVAKLMAAGAVLVGKTNLDQFATGLVGTRSPYGEVPNSFDPAYVSGGSSSGSASVVARGLVPFSLGTDTAGSGRVPAGFNNIVGLKPTPGRVSIEGVVPACRSLDCLSVFALTAADAARVLSVIQGLGTDEPQFATPLLRPARFPERLRVGVPRPQDGPSEPAHVAAFEEAIAQIEAWGGVVERVDLTPFFEVARLLYEGPWVAERYAAVRTLMDRHPEAFDATVHAVIAQARAYDAAAAFEGLYRLRELQRLTEPLWSQVDVLLLPTAPTLPTRAAVAAEPLVRNSELGRYTNFVNLLGLAALALPSGFLRGGALEGLPFGITFVAPGGSDAALAALGARWQAERHLTLGARLGTVDPADYALTTDAGGEPTMPLAVVGAHLSGMPLHGQLVERRCRLRERTLTATAYRLYALPGTTPPKPGLARSEGGGAIELEVYDMPVSEVGSFLALIPSPLGLGSVQLEDGRWVHGFICEPWALAGAQDITHHGGWRAYLQSRQSDKAAA
jgi:allophanate hydrolase